MATTILATASTVDLFGDEFTVVAGTPAGICLVGAGVDNLCRVIAVKKNPAGTFEPTTIELTSARPDGTIVAPGVYKLQRKAGTVGAFRD